MSRVERNRAALAAFASLFAVLTVGVGWFGAPGAGAAEGGELVVQASLGAPTVTFLGASPQEAPGEAWATATGGRTLARYTDADGWETLAEPAAAAGGPIRLASGASAGRTTPAGGVVVAGTEEAEERETLVVRDPGGAPREAADATALLAGEELFGQVDGNRLLAATEEPGGKTGAYVVPGELHRVLHYDGSDWSEEQICLEAAPACEPAAEVQAVAIAAGEGQAWMLGREEGKGLELFHRQTVAGSPAWVLQPLGPSGTLGARFSQPEVEGVEIAPRLLGQPLTVTGKGVWVDAELHDGGGAHDATLYYDDAKGEATGSWCDLAQPALCQFPLESELPAGQGRSFAWPSGGSSYGTRAITGVGQGAIFSLEGSSFRRLTFVGGKAGAENGAALSSPEEGWLGATPPLQLTRNPEAARLQPWPLPLRLPLTAIAAAPEAAVGALGSEALAVGSEGQVARYVPGIGWEPESLLRSSGKRATPNLRGVAWPEPGRAYAVGDGAAVWRWQKATGLWQSDPTVPPNLARANLTGIAFDASDPTRGYIVGKQGVLLGFGREWTQQKLPEGVPSEANFTSIAFAGDEAIATWKLPVNRGGSAAYTGGVIVNSGSGWKVEAGVETALAGAIPQRVAGLPDGGAVIASLFSGEGRQSANGVVIERQGPGGEWQAAAGGSPGYPTALAAVRENGTVRAVISVVPPGAAEPQGDRELATDKEQFENTPPPGAPPLLTDPYPLPGAGTLLRQTAQGWRDEQHQSYPLPSHREGQTLYDLPVRPDPVLALLLSPNGGEGWAVGGETGTFVTSRAATIKTASAMRYGPAATPPSNAATAPIPAESGVAIFALGGHAQCAAACADYSDAGLGPERWLRAAVSRAATVPGMRAFLYAGPGVAAGEGAPLRDTLTGTAFAREEAAYAGRFPSGLPAYVAPAESDLDRSQTLATFQNAFAGFSAPLGSAPPPAGIVPVTTAGSTGGYYSFESTGSGGAVRVVVLDYAAQQLGDTQSCWLAQQLSSAHGSGLPAIVVGERDLAGLAPNAAADRAQTIETLVGLGAPAGCALPGPAGAASAYLFDYPEANRDYRLSSNGRSVPAFGSGTLGYVTPPGGNNTEFAGDSGFLTVSIDAKDYDASSGMAPVNVKLTPSLGSLALYAADGTLLRRSQPALFEALGRRPVAGSGCQGANAPRICEFLSPGQYTAIPSQCNGPNCATSLYPEYTFTSSEPDIADFVEPEPGSTNPRNVYLVKNKPVLDPHSGLLCAFNAGTTTVTVTTGGLSYSQKVTVQAGSVQRPCGTTPLRNVHGAEASPGLPLQPALGGNPSPNPSFPPPPPPATPSAAPSPLQAPPPAHAPAPAPQAPAAPLIPVPAQAALPLVAIVPPPPLPAVQPTPPSGTSQVNAVEREEEEEEAYDMVSQMSALPSRGPSTIAHPAYAVSSEGDDGGLPPFVPALLLVAAAAGAAGIGGRRRPRPRPAFDPINPSRRYR